MDWKIRKLHRETQRSENEFSVSWPMTEQRILSLSDELMLDLSALNDFGLAAALLVNTGVPHLVLINHEEWSPEHRISNSAQLRSHPSLGAEGANITWVSLKNRSAITYEREESKRKLLPVGAVRLPHFLP